MEQMIKMVVGVLAAIILTFILIPAAYANSSVDLPIEAALAGAIPGIEAEAGHDELAAAAFGGETISDAGLGEAAFGGDMSGIESMSDGELGEARGGYGAISFALFGYGDISTLSGGLPEGVSIASQSADLVSLQVGLANLPNTGGFVQFASIVGNNNVINHTLNLNVYIINGGVADTSGFTSGAAFGF